MKCSSCNRERAITLSHTIRVGRRLVTFVECVACFLTAEIDHGNREPETLAQAERAGV